MKNILVPTDFSACASDAIKTALDIAETYNAKIHLFTNLNLSSGFINTLEKDKTSFPEDLQKVENAKTLLDKWKELAQRRNIELTSGWKGGHFLENIKDEVSFYDIDFIVMGSHGVSGKSEYFIGSNTQRVVRTVSCPVLVIKDYQQKFNLEKVIFASDFGPEQKVVLEYLLDLIKPYNPEIHLLQINTSSWFTQPYILVKETMNDFKEMCHPFKVETHFYRDWTIDAGIRHMSEEIGADLAIISNIKKHPLKRIFAGSNVEALINHADFPVLSVDFDAVSLAKKSKSIAMQGQ